MFGPWRYLLQLFSRHQSTKFGFLSLNFSIQSYSKLKQAYCALGLPEDAKLEEVKNAYVQLSYKLHPDTGGENANAAKLETVREAYKFVLKSLEVDANDSSLTQQNTEFDIQHTAPQHRQFLEHGDVGPGTLFERQKQAQQMRFSKAVENTREYSFEKASLASSVDQSSLLHLEDRKFAARRAKQNSKMTGMIERVVEDMILAAMETGTFSNLKGAGKPLADDFSNPYIDETDKRINKVLRNNGFLPLWISREGDIRDAAALMRKELIQEARRLKSRKPVDMLGLQNALRQEAEKRVQPINRLIRDYNLITPVLDRQLMELCPEQEVNRSIAATAALAAANQSQQMKKNMEKDEEMQSKDIKKLNSLFNALLKIFRSAKT